LTDKSRVFVTDRQPPTPAMATQGKTGFVGLGRMGTVMAANLAAAGRQVIAYVRRQDRMNELAELGLQATTDIADLFDCEIVVSMLPDDDAVLDAAFGRAGSDIEGFAVGLSRGAIHLSMGTIGAGAASHLAKEHARHGQGYVAAPVFGIPDAASARQLFIVTAGAPIDVASTHTVCWQRRPYHPQSEFDCHADHG
jgi:3-hydroxyisobutyrate dehydrogenase-like beta-hydroxyacid dehydrogenase